MICLCISGLDRITEWVYYMVIVWVAKTFIKTLLCLLVYLRVSPISSARLK